MAPKDKKPAANDDQYQSFKRCFLASGKGRRPTVSPSLELDNRMLLQLYALKLKSSSTFLDVHSWMERIVPDANLDISRMKYLLERAWLKALQLLAGDGGEDSFLLFCGDKIDFGYVSDSLNMLGLSRNILLHPESYVRPIPMPEITNAIIIDLEGFKKACKLKDSFLFSWLSTLIDSSDHTLIKKSAAKVLKDFLKFQKRKSRHPEEFHAFTVSKFMSSDSVSVQSMVTKEDGNHILATKNVQTQTKQTSVNTSSQQTDDNLYVILEDKVQKLQEEKVLCSKNLSHLASKINQIRQSKLYKSNYALRKETEGLKETNVKLEQENASLRHLLTERANVMGVLTRKCENVQKDKSRLKKERDENRSRLDECMKILNDSDRASPEIEKLETRDNRNNKFKDDIRITAMALFGEAGVATSKCPLVIGIVARLLFHQHLDLPHWTTVTKWVDEFNVISKLHIVDECRQTNHITLHTDATSRDKRRYVGQQMTLGDGTSLSLGYTEVATEDAQTLLETTTSFLEDLLDVMETSSSRDTLFRDILSKITSTMSDRAAVMKSFNFKFNEFRRSKLGQEITTEFLFCNAHFLLGLSSSCEEALKGVEQKIKGHTGSALGRDGSSKFFNWHSIEGATARTIRTTADCLGPRSDEKNGCREEWLAYCRQMGLKSSITSYRSNRFNNLFANATAILTLRDDIISFLETYASSSNLKLTSVFLDLGDSSICSCLCAVALLHVHVTEPYWKLVNSATLYLDLPRYIQMMEGKFQDWIGQIDELFSPSCQGIFDGEYHSTESLSSILSYVSPDSLVYAQEALQGCLVKMVEVTRRQLCDFLPGGTYGGVVAEEVRESLKHCPITNLSGEHAFGDLDYDLNQRRHASLHNRSTKQLIRWNNDISWLEGKCDKDREDILIVARKKKAVFKDKFRKQEELVKLKIKLKIMENHQQKLEKERQLAERKQKIIDKVLKDGGVCKCKNDVNRLQTVDSLKAQLQYHKIVMGVKSVKISGDREDLLVRLKTFLDTGEILKSKDSSPPKKRRKTEVEEDVESSEDSGQEEVSNEVEETVLDRFTFEGKAQGLWVAVYYDDSPYIGQVIEIVDSENASIKFLTSTKCRKDLFKWPRADDIAIVNSSFVFMWDLDVSPVSSDGRTWQVMEYHQIERSYSRIISTHSQQ